VTITSDEIRTLCRRAKDTGFRSGRFHSLTLNSGLTLRIYCTEERNYDERSTIIEGPDQLWFLVVKKWNFSFDELRYISTERELVFMMAPETIAFEIRGDQTQFLQDMALCRLFDDLISNDDVRMAA